MSFSPNFQNDNVSTWDQDRATLSNYRDVRTTHIDLDWTIDWKHQVIFGQAVLNLVATNDVDHVKLDSSYLDIKDIRIEGQGKEAEFVVGERIGAMGEGLTIQIGRLVKAGEVSLIS
jgi:leukotriene-A4 hydrolase